MEIRTGNSDSNSSCHESSSFDRVQRRSNESQEDQFDPGKAEEGTTAPTSKSEQDQTTGIARRRGDQQQEDQERKGASTTRSISLEVLVGDANYKS
ncbi:hypothetical protein TNCV_37611 [Trichonephila clavipes]|nr:hypothetical protein TNCV_37611 [Trichonephila clavipes]